MARKRKKEKIDGAIEVAGPIRFVEGDFYRTASKDCIQAARLSCGPFAALVSRAMAWSRDRGAKSNERRYNYVILHDGQRVCEGDCHTLAELNAVMAHNTKVKAKTK